MSAWSCIRPSCALLLALALLAPGQASLAQAFPTPQGEGLGLDRAIDKAGRQRMLTQQIVKAYLEIGLGLEEDHARYELVEAVRLFESQLAELDGFAGDAAELEEQLRRLYGLWVPFRELALGPVSLRGARRLAERDPELLRTADELALSLEIRSDQPHATLTNIAGRQRMLSQQVAKLYMMLASGIDEDLTRDKLRFASEEFESGLEFLIAAPQNTPEIAADLEAAREQWMWLESSLDFARYAERSGNPQHYYPLIVERLSDKLLLIMERVTERYRRLFPSDAG